MNHHRKQLILAFVFLLLCQSVFSQSFSWAKSYKSNKAFIITRDITKYKNHIYTVGEFNGTCDFDPGPGSAFVTNNGVSTNINVYVTKFDTLGNFVWVKTFGSAGETFVLKTTVDSKGNIYVCGRFSNTCDFDPGAGVYNLTANMEKYYILKLNPAGNFIWAKSFGYSDQQESFKSIAVDESDNLITIGGFLDSIDLDPGPARVVHKAIGDPDGFIQILDSNGNYLNGITIGARGLDGIAFDKQNFYVSGFFYDQCDFDPGPNTFILKTNYAASPYILKLDRSLNFIWAKTYALSGGAGPTYLDNDGNLFILGGYTKTADFDPGPGQYILTYKGINSNSDPFFLKLDSAGNFIWAKSIPPGSPGYYAGYKTAMDFQGNFYISGSFKGTVNFDPGPAVFNLKSNNNQCGFMAKYDPDGNFIWAHGLGDTTAKNDVIVTSFVIDSPMNIYACGAYNVPVDFDPDTTKYRITPLTNVTYDAFLFKWKQNACSSLVIVVDSFIGADCGNNGTILVHASRGKSPYTYQWSTSPPIDNSTLGFKTHGQYTVSVSDNNKCLKHSTFITEGPDTLQGYDLQAHLVSQALRPGFNSRINIDACNSTCTKVNGELRLVLNNLIKYTGANPAPSAIIGDTLIWSFNSLDYHAGHLKPVVFINVSKLAKIGDITCFELTINPAINDLNPGNNARTYCQKIVSSYDPNDKKVFPEGVCMEHYILKTDELIYTIRFQNTGNASAINVIIEDKLDKNLDINSVQIYGKSHENLLTEIGANNTLRFSFKNIQLPYSSADFEGSQGYIVFKVKQQPNLANGIKIFNTSFIYFDFNPPIITNTTTNTISSSIPFENTSINQVSCDSFNLGDKTYFNSGIYKKRLFGSDGCDSIINLSLTITKADTAVTVSNSTLISKAAGATYQWLDCKNGNPIKGATSQSFTATVSGNYAVAISVNDCKDTSGCYAVNISSINASAVFQSVTLWPNPSNKYVTAYFPEPSGLTELSVSDITGRILTRKTMLNPQSVELILGETTGLYFVTIRNDAGNIVYKVFRE